MAKSTLLPENFSDLEPFAKDWAVATMAQRMQRRFDSTAAQRREFYARVAPRAAAALDYLNMIPFAQIKQDSKAERLMKLTLMLAEIALTEEINGQDVEVGHALSNRQIFVTHEMDGL